MINGKEKTDTENQESAKIWKLLSIMENMYNSVMLNLKRLITWFSGKM